jgi:DNA-binding MarR family transcriptional regulator
MESNSSDCHCLMLRKAARRTSNFYDAELAPSGLRTTQFSILAAVFKTGEITVNAIAERLALDRTTAGKNLRPLEAAKLIRIAPSKQDRRARAITLTAAGLTKFREAAPLWRKAQTRFEALNGKTAVASLRTGLNGLKLDTA